MEETRKAGEPSGRDCPVCKAPTVWRDGRYSWFHGCSKFPACYGKIGAPRGKSAKAVPAPKPEAPKQEFTCPVCWRSKVSDHITVCDSMSRTDNCADKIEKQEDRAAIWRMLDAEKFNEVKILLETKPDGEKEMPKNEVVTTPPPMPGDLGSLLALSLGPAIAQSMEPKVALLVAEAVTKALSEQQAVKVEWKVNDVKLAEWEGARHEQLENVLKRVKAGLKNILLVGPAGSGKTQLAHDLAKSLGRQFSSVSCTAGMPEWHIVGRSMPNLQNGTSVYSVSRFVECYENGGVALLDEIDAADPNTLLVINSAMANGHLDLPSRTEKPVAKRHPDFVLIASANTYGTGPSRTYVGRNQLDAATLSRFACAVVEMDYDRSLEKTLVPEGTVREKVWAIREKVAKFGLRRVVGTRELIACASLVRSGESADWAVKAMLVGWTEDELGKCGLK